MKYKKSILLLALISLFYVGLTQAALTELIGNPAIGDPDTDPGGTPETIFVKDSGDSFTADEFNLIVDLLRGVSRDDNNTAGDQTDDKVGINGILNPSEALDVNGRVRATAYIGDGSLLTGINAGFWIENGGEINYPSGNVGIGVPDPDARLDVAGNIQAASHVESGVGSGGVALTVNDGYGNANLTFNHTRGRAEQDGNAGRIEVNTDATTNASMSFELADGLAEGVATALDSIMTLRSTGNVGIGTAAPVNNLHIQDPGNYPGISFTGTSGATTTTGEIQYEGGTGSFYYEATGAGDHVFRSAGDTLVRIQDNGNVGIGTVNPGSSLEVVGRVQIVSDASDQFRLERSAGVTGLYSLGISTAGDFYVRDTESGGTFPFVIEKGAGADGALRIDDAGNVGVGNIDPDYKLDVDGDVNFTGNLRQNGVIFSSGGKFVDGVDPAEAVYTGGNVGVGTTNPLATLDINTSSSVELGFTGPAAANINSVTGETFFIRNQTNNDLRLGTNNTDRLIINGGGDVGIGVAPSGSSALTVESGGENQLGLRLLSSGNGFFDVRPTNTNGFDTVISTVNSRDLIIETGGGNVGVGETTPLAQLEVADEGEIVRFSRLGSSQYVGIDADAGGNDIRSYSQVNNAKQLVIDATTDASNTAPTAGSNGINLRIRGGNALSIGDDRSVAIGRTAAATPNQTLQVESNPTVDATTYQLLSSVAATSPALTADRTSFGGHFSVINNKTENGSNDSDGTGVYGRSYTTGTNTFRINRGLYGEARNDSTAASGLGNLYGVQGAAYQNAISGTIPSSYGVYGYSYGDTTVGSTSRVTTAAGVYGLMNTHETDVTSGYGLFGIAQTITGDQGSIATAYGVRGIVDQNSTAGGGITTAYGAHVATQKTSGAPNIGTATGVFSNVDGATNAYGAQLYANDPVATNNYGLYVEARNASGNNIGILGAFGDWLLQDPAGQVGLRDTTPDLDLVLDVEGKVGADQYCDENGNNCVLAEDLGGGLWEDTGSSIIYNAQPVYAGKAVGLATEINAQHIVSIGDRIGGNNDAMAPINLFGSAQSGWGGAFMGIDSPNGQFTLYPHSGSGNFNTFRVNVGAAGELSTEGKLAVGTTGAAYQVDIDDNAASGAGLRVRGGGSGQPLAVFQRDVGGTGAIVVSSSGSNPQFYLSRSSSNIFSVGVDSTGFKISDNATVGANDRFVVDNAGNVGIGAGDPNARLEVEGGSNNWNAAVQGTGVGSIHLDPENSAANHGSAITWGASDSSAGDTAQAGIYVRSDGTYGTRMYLSTTSSYATGAQTALMIDNNRNIGIGTTAPAYDLDVAGDVNLTGDLYQNGTLFKSGKFVDGTNAANAVYTGGDIGIKTTTPEVSLHILDTADASLSAGSGVLQIGNTAGTNLIIDNNEILARNNGSNSTLVLQQTGGGADFNGHVGIGGNGDVNANHVLQVEENQTIDANTIQVYSGTTSTSPPLTADRTSYGTFFTLTNNKTENGSFDSDAIAHYGRVVTNGTNTFRLNRGVYGEARNDSTATSGLGTLYGSFGLANQNALSGNIPSAYGVYGQAQGDTTPGVSSTITTAVGVQGITYPFESDMAAAYGTYGTVATFNGDGGTIGTAYGSRGYVSHDSDDGGSITTAYGGYFTTRKRSTATNIGTAVGVYSNVDGATTVYGGQFYANDAVATSNRGIYVEARNASTTNHAIVVGAGDIVFPNNIRLRTASGEMRCPVNQMMVGFDTNGIICDVIPQVYQ